MSSITHVFMHVLDLQKSKVFYESLGLKVVMNEPKYVRLAGKNGLYIGMEQRDTNEVGSSGIELNLKVDDVDKLYEDLTAKGIQFDQKPTDMPWGARSGFLNDPNGYRIGLYS